MGLNAKVGSQEIPRVTGKFGLGAQNEAGQRLTEFCQENNTRDHSAHGHHQMVSIEIRLIIFFVAEDGEAVYRQQKQDLELIDCTSDHQLSSSQQNSGLN